jgi:hypothetical protein
VSSNQVNLKKFKDSLKKMESKFVQDVGKDMHLAVGQHVYERVILRTPVLTGHARHNWLPSVNDQQVDEILGVFGGDTTGEPITSEERAKWAAVRQGIRSQPLGQTIWICNNVPYAQRLEHGWSKKAPTGMVEITLREILEGVFKNQPRMMNDDGGT